MIKYLTIVMLLLAGCKTTDALTSCDDRIAQFDTDQLAAGHKPVAKAAVAPNTFAVVYGDGRTYYVLGLIAPGGVLPPANFTPAGSCMVKDTPVLVYQGTMAAEAPAPSRDALARPH